MHCTTFIAIVSGYTRYFSLTNGTVERGGLTPRHLINKNNDDTAEFSGVGGETTKHTSDLPVIRSR